MAVTGPEKTAIRDDAAAILGWIGKPATPALVGALRSSNAFARQGAVTALGLTKDEAAVGPLVELAADPAVKADNALMLKIYEALGSSGQRRALAPLVEAVKSESPGERRRAAIQALQALGDIRAVDTLVEILGDGKGDDAGMVREAIQALTEYSPDEEDKTFDWKVWWRANRKKFNLKRP
jgi:HEAT repeat protein